MRLVRCEVCLTNERLILPAKYAWLVVMHILIDHRIEMSTLERAICRSLPSGERLWMVGRRKSGFPIVRVIGQD